MKHEIFGIKTDNDEKKFNDEFEIIADYDSETYYQSKQTYQFRDNELNFDYKFVVEVYDIHEMTGKEVDEYSVSLLLVPTLNSLNPQKKQNVLDQSCIDEDEATMYDIVSYGIRVTLGAETIKQNGKYWDECEPLQEALNAIANVYDTVNSLLGFYLDKYVNRIGNDGWDLLQDFINGVDFIKARLNRLS